MVQFSFQSPNERTMSCFGIVFNDNGKLLSSAHFEGFVWSAALGVCLLTCPRLKHKNQECFFGKDSCQGCILAVSKYTKHLVETYYFHLCLCSHTLSVTLVVLLPLMVSCKVLCPGTLDVQKRATLVSVLR